MCREINLTDIPEAPYLSTTTAAPPEYKFTPCEFNTNRIALHRIPIKVNDKCCIDQQTNKPKK